MEQRKGKRQLNQGVRVKRTEEKEKRADRSAERTPPLSAKPRRLRCAAAGRRPTSARFCTLSAQHLRIFGCFSSFQKIMEKL